MGSGRSMGRNRKKKKKKTLQQIKDYLNDQSNRIEYYESEDRLLTKEEMTMANEMWEKYGI